MTTRVTTLWYLDSDDPGSVIRSATSDPGFGRRLLSRLYPTVTVTSLGVFPLNRSASAGPGEIYIGSYPGLTVIQSCEPEADRPSALPDRWRLLVPCRTLLAFSVDPDSGVSGFARWEDGTLVRAFAGSADRILDDQGLPQTVERPFWAGEYPQEDADSRPLALPFDPAVLLRHTQRDWLGFDLTPDGADLAVHGFATDGRREVRHGRPLGPGAHVSHGHSRAERHSRSDSGSTYYDDYERALVDGPRDRSVRTSLGQAAVQARSALTDLRRRAGHFRRKPSGS